MSTSWRYCVLLICACVLLGSTMAVAGPGKLYVCQKGKFKVVFPFPMGITEDPTREQTPVGLVEGAACHEHDDRTIYWVTSEEYPAGSLDPNPQVTLGRVVDGTAKGFGATIESRTPFQLRGHPGLSISASRQGASPLWIQVSVVVVGNRIYRIRAWTAYRETLLNPATRTFFSSFDIL